MPFVTDEVVTAAKLNMATVNSGDIDASSRTFTNTSYLDLDALTGGAGTLTAVTVTVTTGTVAIVTFGGIISNSGGQTLIAYRVSGATTIASNDGLVARNGSTTLVSCSFAMPVTLTAGSNVFELQARVTGGTGTLGAPWLIVQGVV